MNLKNPLVAALLTLSTSAAAQFLAPAQDDMLFKCSTVPYRPCTDKELADRNAIVAAGRCPMPASDSCQKYLMRNGDTSNPFGTLAAKDPDPTDEGFEWADPSCTHIPCQIKEPAAKKSKKFAGSSGVNDSIQGPPELVDMPKGGPQGKMLKYPSGRVEYCFDDTCTKTSGKPGMTPAQARSYLRDKYADAKQEANSLNSGSGSLNADNPTGVTTLSTPIDPYADAGDSGSDDANPIPTSGGASDPGALGRELADDQNTLALLSKGGFGASDAGGSSGGDFSTGDEAGAAGGNGGNVAVVNIDGSSIKHDNLALTFGGTKKAAKRIDEVSRNVNFTSPRDGGPGNQVVPGGTSASANK